MKRTIVDLSIVVPTLNEEDYIGNLLSSLSIQTVFPKSLIIVDASSKDGTINVIKEWVKIFPHLKFFIVKPSTIATQRNYGVAKSSSKHILFLDADIMMAHRDSLEKFYKDIEKEKPDVAINSSNLADSKDWQDQVSYAFWNLLVKATKEVWPLALGSCLYVKKSSFKEIKGFDESIAVGEDMELVHRMVKNEMKFAVVNNPKIYVSVRRHKKEGRRRYMLKMTKLALHQIKNGFKDIPVDYEFGKFKETS